jgi:hypothetical protein
MAICALLALSARAAQEARPMSDYLFVVQQGERVGEPVELLEPGIGVVLAVLGVAGNLDGDDVLGDVVPPVGRPLRLHQGPATRNSRFRYARRPGAG